MALSVLRCRSATSFAFQKYQYLASPYQLRLPVAARMITIDYRTDYLPAFEDHSTVLD